MRFDADQTVRPDQTAELERALIADFLEQRGHTVQSVKQLPDEARHALMRSASLHASMRLAEVETRAHYVDDLRQK